MMMMMMMYNKNKRKNNIYDDCCALYSLDVQEVYMYLERRTVD